MVGPRRGDAGREALEVAQASGGAGADDHGKARTYEGARRLINKEHEGWIGAESVWLPQPTAACEECTSAVSPVRTGWEPELPTRARRAAPERAHTQFSTPTTQPTWAIWRIYETIRLTTGVEPRLGAADAGAHGAKGGAVA